jgi:hypothetical protein
MMRIGTDEKWMRDQLPERVVPLVPEHPGGHLLAAGVLLATLALPAVFASPVAAATPLRNGSVTPALGTTQTSFAFSVDYVTPSPQQAASSVTAVVGPTSVGLTLTTGTATDGTWTGQSTLPAGTWQVTFVAATAGSDPTLSGPTVVVVGPPPSATPTPAPTPRPTASPRPTANPTPAPTRTPIPPPTAAPIPTFGPPIPSGTPAASGRPTPTGSPSGSGPARPTPSASAAGASESARPSAATGSSLPSPSAAPAEASKDPGLGANPWLFVGGGLAFVGAVIIGDQMALRRAARRPPPVEGE